MTANVNRDSVWQSAGATILSRCYASDGDPLVQADLTSIACIVVDLATGSTVVAPSVVVATSVFDELQVDSLWTADTDGYNFRFTLPASAFPTANKIYRVEVKATPVSGPAFFLYIGEHTAERTYSA